MRKKYNKQIGLLTNRQFFYGWIIVFVSGLGVFFSSPGQTYNVSVFINSLIEYFGWSRSLVSMLYSFGSLFAGLTVGIIGKAIDHIGHRKMAPIIAFLLGAACLLMSFIINPVMLFFGFFLIRLLGVGSMMIWPSTLVPKWFDKKRGRALSLIGIGGMAGAALFPPLNTWIINNWGWKVGWQFWTIPLWLVMAPLAWLLIRNKPEEVGLVSNGISDNPEPKGGGKDHKKISIPSLTLSEARRTSAYWLLLYCLLVPAMLNTGITFHIVSILGERGLSPTVAATTLSIVAIVGFPSTLIAGYIYDRIKIRYILIATFIFYFFILVWLQNVDTLSKSIIYGVSLGIMMGFFGVMVNIVGPNYFGLDYLGSIRGSMQAALLFGTAFGPLPIGLAYDYFGGYTEILWIILIFPALAVIASWFTGLPSKKS